MQEVQEVKEVGGVFIPNSTCRILASSNASSSIESTDYLDSRAISVSGQTYLRADQPRLSGSCTPNGGQRQGGLTETGTHTICCQEDM